MYQSTKVEKVAKVVTGVVEIACDDPFKISAECEKVINSCDPNEQDYTALHKCAMNKFKIALGVVCASRTCDEGKTCKLTGQSVQSVDFPFRITRGGTCYLKCTISGTGKCSCE